jgi:FG-GAP-like repeat
VINQGNGAFAAQVTYPTRTTPSSVTAADLDGDGNPDLAIATSIGTVSRMLTTCLL